MMNAMEDLVVQMNKLKIHSKQIKSGVWEVEGIIFYAKTHYEAIRKYLRKNKPLEYAVIVEG